MRSFRYYQDDWLSTKQLGKLNLRNEGIMVLGIQKPDGTYQGIPTTTTVIQPNDTVLLYGRGSSLTALSRRRAGIGGELAHTEAVAEQEQVSRKEAGGQVRSQQLQNT